MTRFLFPILSLVFVGMGLSDPLLGAAWPTMGEEFRVPLAYGGIPLMIFSACIAVSVLFSGKLLRLLGAWEVVTISAVLSAAALLGYAMSDSFWMLCLCAVPCGLGAGAMDAALNHYAATHYPSRYMNWLHGLWGAGACLGPLLMGGVLAWGAGWRGGYQIAGLAQIAVTAVLFCTLPLWDRERAAGPETESLPLSLRDVLRLPGAKQGVVFFFFYSTIEQTAGLWASTYLAEAKGFSPEQAAGAAGLFVLGLTGGRAAGGCLAKRLTDTQMIRLGEVMAALGLLCLLLPGPPALALLGLLALGLGCAPAYPCILHATPGRFGASRSQAVMGVQMAAAYGAACVMPPLIGALAGHTAFALLPCYLLAALAVMAAAHRRLNRQAPASPRKNEAVSLPGGT